jgi:thiamine biosynthesis lipoprotein
MAIYTAVATSSTTEGSPWRSVTVVAASCARAERAATAAITKEDRAIDWLQRRRLAARLVEIDGTIHYIGRWPDPTEQDAA